MALRAVAKNLNSSISNPFEVRSEGLLRQQSKFVCSKLSFFKTLRVQLSKSYGMDLISPRALASSASNGSKMNGNVDDMQYTFAVLGDLHLEPAQMEGFSYGRSQIVKELTNHDSGKIVDNAHLFQLGDVGGYEFQPGSRACFKNAVDFLNGFGIPRLSVLGNHDLEGEEFDTDESNLKAWQEEFGQNHYWSKKIGPVLCIGLSTVRFRAAVDSCHEVFIDEEQLAWFQSVLEANKGTRTFVFSHAPPMGSGLTSLQQVHVRNRCAWLNHSQEPGKFLEIVNSNPQINLWFSGHFHLSHDYEGSLCRVGSCLFVQTGVMGECHRDGKRHSRIVKGGSHGFILYTYDHGSGSLRQDVTVEYSSHGMDNYQRHWCSNLSYLTGCPGGGSFSPEMASILPSRIGQSPPSAPSSVRWWQQGDTVLALNSNQIVQYSVRTRAPLGIVVDALNAREVNLVCSDTGVVEAIELLPTEASIALTGKEGVKGKTGYEIISRNSEGGFWQIFQVNKWLLRRQRAAAEAAMAAVAGSIPPPF